MAEHFSPTEIAALLESAVAIIRAEVEALPKAVATFHPGEAEWSVNEVIGHLIEAERRGFAGRLESKRGDFVELAAGIAPADVVTLDRVICCYPDMKTLVSESAAHARQLYGVVIPRENRLVRVMRLGINTVFRVMRNPFRFYIHPSREIEAVLARFGFKPLATRDTLVWRVAVYSR